MMTIYTRKERYSFFLDYKSSGLSQKEFCRRKNLAYSQFRNWVFQYKNSKEKNNKSNFLPVRIAEKQHFNCFSESIKSPIILQVNPSIRMEIPQTISSQWVVEVLRGLQA